jgi:hypothetical protein
MVEPGQWCSGWVGYVRMAMPAEAMYQRIEAKKWKVASLSIQRQKLFTNLTKFYLLFSKMYINDA